MANMGPMEARLRNIDRPKNSFMRRRLEGEGVRAPSRAEAIQRLGGRAERGVTRAALAGGKLSARAFNPIPSETHEQVTGAYGRFKGALREGSIPKSQRRFSGGEPVQHVKKRHKITKGKHKGEYYTTTQTKKGKQRTIGKQVILPKRSIVGIGALESPWGISQFFGGGRKKVKGIGGPVIGGKVRL